MRTPDSGPKPFWTHARVVSVGIYAAVITWIAALIVGHGEVSFFRLVRDTYDAATLWCPIVLLAYGVLLGAVGRGGWARVALFTAIALVGVRVWATHIEPNQLVVRRVTITTDKVDRPIRIVHMSDIQAAAIGEHERASLAAVHALKPDLVIHTGDIVQPIPPVTYSGALAELEPLLEAIHAPLGRFNVRGDVDRPIIGLLDEYRGFTTLVDQTATVAVGRSRLRLHGLSVTGSRSPEAVRDHLATWVDEDPGAFSIVFGHAPDFAVGAVTQPVDLILAGHTHGGQIRLPFVGPLITLSDVPRDWARGYRAVGKSRLNVSAGIGAEHAAQLPSIRLNCPPEVTLIVLLPDSSLTNSPVVTLPPAGPIRR